MTDRYPDSTLDEKFRSIEDKLDEQFEAQNKVLFDIKDQTTKTNGRVGSLEGWRQYNTGGLTMLAIVIVPALGFLAYMVIQTANHVSAIDAIITQLETK
jgi:3-methyladenine DNA glycosylase/8-oxoguanine DNA glycosylase